MFHQHKTSVVKCVFWHTFAVLTICLLFTTVQAQNQVTVNSLSKAGVFAPLGSTVSQLNFNHTINSGSNRALYVLIATFGQTRTVSPRVATVRYVTDETPARTFDLTPVGTAFSPGIVQVPPLPSGSLSTAEVYRFYLPQTFPASSMGQVQVTTVATDYIFATATTLNNVNSNTPNRGFFTDNGNYNPNNGTDAPAVTVSDAQTGDLVIDILSTTFGSGSALEGPGQNVCTDPLDETTCTRGREFFGGISDVGASSRERAMSPVTMSWTTSGGGDYALAAFAVAVATAPTAASVPLGGRIFSATGRAVSGARVRLIEADGNMRYVVTNPFGYFRFEAVSVGQTITLEADSKRYKFAPRIVTVNEELTDLNFTAEK